MINFDSLLHQRNSQQFEQFFSQDQISLLCRTADSETADMAAKYISSVLGSKDYNIFHIQPESGRTVGIDLVRGIISETKYSLGSTKQAIVISGMSSVTIEAQNSFLKTLEEPNSQIQFVICVSGNVAILPTVESRLQTIDIYPAPTSTFTALVAEGAYNKTYTTEQLQAITGNSIGKVMRLLSGGDELVDIASDAKRFLASSIFDRLVLLHGSYSKRADLEKFIDQLLILLGYILSLSSAKRKTQATSKMILKIQRLQASLQRNASVKGIMGALVFITKN